MSSPTITCLTKGFLFHARREKASQGHFWENKENESGVFCGISKNPYYYVLFLLLL